ncbi:MAG TPA: polysaccharide biosynthesis/export family protein [Candidatus Baltobacteraceae bacterium]|nr:polysaccharide biosynthesis/export family protein [Candidatus Baltobacteraceae bacterium]
MVGTVRGVSDWLRAKIFILLGVLLFFGAVQAASAQEATETPQQKTEKKAQELASLGSVRPTDAVIGSGDILHVDVFDVPELSRDVRVSDTGDISYPLIPGKILVAGLTPFQLESKLEELLLANGLVSHPQVSVFVKEQNSQPVTVVGAVGHAMVYQVIRPTTLLEVLTQAGGVSDNAGNVVIVTRPKPAGEAKTEPASATTGAKPDVQTITIPLQSLLASGDSVFNIQIYGGDTITVPPAGIIYVLGSGVATPGEYVLEDRGEQVTVLKALALAHGLTGFAKPNSAVIMRTNPQTGQRDAIPVHIKEIENRKADDVAMKSNDILYIPDSAGKKALARGSEAAIGIGTGIAIYRVQ